MWKYFHLSEEQEDYDQITETITKGVVFSGTNLLVLVFAIVVASVGLNVNSTAVIIGAMLISPLMGPIMGIGLGVGTYDFSLIRISLKNFAFSVGVSLMASTVYFLISPLNEAHSELLARTSPNIYDVLIAFFGGLAGITAITSKQKGNALQGAAIATALMPPLCTAGFGIATQQWRFFFGAFYLFLINSVFISLATYITIRLLKFPTKEIGNLKLERFLKRTILLVTLLTLLPSVYLGYRLIEAEKFRIKAKNFIESEFSFEDIFILEKKTDFSKRQIAITIGGANISKEDEEKLREKMKLYGLVNVELLIKNTLSFRSATNTQEEKINLISRELTKKQSLVTELSRQIDSIQKQRENYEQISEEILIQYRDINKAVIRDYSIRNDTASKFFYMVNLVSNKNLSKDKIEKLSQWLKKRLKTNNIEIFVKIN